MCVRVCVYTQVVQCRFIKSQLDGMALINALHLDSRAPGIVNKAAAKAAKIVGALSEVCIERDIQRDTHKERERARDWARSRR